MDKEGQVKKCTQKSKNFQDFAEETVENMKSQKIAKGLLKKFQHVFS